MFGTSLRKVYKPNHCRFQQIKKNVQFNKYNILNFKYTSVKCKVIISICNGVTQNYCITQLKVLNDVIAIKCLTLSMIENKDLRGNNERVEL